MIPQFVIHARTQTELEMLASMFLETRGFQIVAPGGSVYNNWETRAELCARLKISPRTLRRKLKRPKHPPIRVDGDKVCASREFEQWARSRRSR